MAWGGVCLVSAFEFYTAFEVSLNISIFITLNLMIAFLSTALAF